jgi:hypothetical protein
MLIRLSAILPVFLIIFSACGDRAGGPDISGIQAEVKFRRFDQALSAIDSSRAESGWQQLQQEYPQLGPLFIYQILGLDSSSAVPGLRRFLHLSNNLLDTVRQVFSDTRDLEKQFSTAFRYLKYYFPQYPLPEVVTLVGPVDALAESDQGPTPNFLRPGLLGISLQFYLGSRFSVYQDPYFIQQVAPQWRSRRFSREYIIADAMPLIINDLFPDNSAGKPLAEQMVEKGKRWWLLEQLLPEVPDSVRTGYTQSQLDWCRENEGLIWAAIIRNNELSSLNPATIQNYIGEGPFTQGFSQELSPGNLGAWIGWQIVRKFMKNNRQLKPEELMQYDSRQLLEAAKYRPK